MFKTIKTIKTFKLLMLGLGLLLPFAGQAGIDEQAPLQLDVYQADGSSFYVSSVLVSGKSEAVLVDAQFTLADAHVLVAKILRSGKRLKAVYISHGDPDYYFGLQVIKQAFPGVKVYATAKTIEHISATKQKKLEYWGPKLGANGPDKIIMPQLLPGDRLMVDGQALNIVGLDKHPERTYVWIPSIKAVLGGVPVYGNTHLWIADAASKAQRQAWLDILAGIEGLQPAVVIPGHASQDAAKTLASVKFSQAYLKDYERLLADAKDSKALVKKVNALYPKAKLPIALEIGAKVAKGEMKW